MLMATNLERWVPPLERMPFVADRAVCIEALQEWLSGLAEERVCAILHCTMEQFAKWKADESFGYLKACLVDPVRHFRHGQLMRLEGQVLTEIEKRIPELGDRALVQLAGVLGQRTEAIEERMKGEEEVPESVKDLWKRLESWSKANPVKGREVAVVDAEVVRAAD